MNTPSIVRQRLLTRIAALAVITGAGAAHAADSYDPQTQQLTIPSIIIGSADYQNLVVKVHLPLLQPPGGTGPNEIGDFYDTTLNDLFVAEVMVGSTLYYNPVVSLDSLVSIGSVDGAALYSGGLLTLPSVQILGGPLYQGVAVSVGPSQIRSIGSGMPTVSQNTYDPATGLLTIPVVAVNGKYYTNVTATATLVNVVHVLGGHQELDSVIHTFNGTTDGANPAATVIQGADGNFYGTTTNGGNGYGTVFSLTPAGVYTVLYTFNGTDGTAPFAPLVRDSTGNLYGTTSSGGQYGEGTVFEIPAGGSLTTLWSFQGGGGVTGSADGANPNGLVLAQDGNLYGTTTNGGSGSACGASGCGVVFQVALPSGVETPLYSFAGGTDGQTPYAGLVQASNGLLYGTTFLGGANSAGTLFSVTTAGAESVVCSFGATASDGAYPESAPIQGTDGNLYGTTNGGGSYGVGTVFSYNLTSGQEQALYSFGGAGGLPGSADGAYPFTGVVQGTDGALYGAANYGGAYNEGTVYRVVIATGSESTLYSFNGDNALAGSNDGAYPNELIQGADGFLYGTAYNGGTTNSGVVFRVAP